MAGSQPPIGKRARSSRLTMDHDETTLAALPHDMPGIPKDIEDARNDLLCYPKGHPERAGHAKNLSLALYIHYQKNGDLGLLDEAIELDREILAAHPEGHPGRADSCRNLAISLHHRSMQTGDGGLLDQAIALKCEALALHPEGHPDRVDSCRELAISLHERSMQTGDGALLDEAIALKREALALRPEGHPDRADSCRNLAVSLYQRSKQTGDGGLLDKAIALYREALALRPEGHPDRADSCRNLAASLYERSMQTGDGCLLDEAIALDRRALALCPEGRPDRADSCRELAISLHERSKQTGDGGLLDEAIALYREALALCPKGHPDWADNCQNLAVSLHERSQQTGDDGLLDKAIALDREALALCPEGHPDRTNSCTALAVSLHSRYKQNTDIALLGEAVELLNDALSHSTPFSAWYPLMWLCIIRTVPGTPHFSLSNVLHRLDLHLLNGFDNIRDYISLICYIFSQLWKVSNTWTHDDTIVLVGVYAKVIDRLPFLASFVLDASSRLQTLYTTRQIGSHACVVALLADQPSKAVELLDRGHGVVWTQALHQRDPQMEGAPIELATELESRLRALALPMANADGQPLPDSQDLRHQHNTRIQAILRELRAMPGLARFMLGSTYETLQNAARQSPVVVLIAAHGHAFALIMASATEEQPHTLRLDVTSENLLSLRGSAEDAGMRSRADTRGAEADERVGFKISKAHVHQAQFRVLADIWRKIVKPVLDHMQIEASPGRARPRLHWCPNGDFTFLPLHAAGICSGREAERVCCSDYVVSSYTPTISALLRAQAQAASIASADVDMLLVAEDCRSNPSMGTLRSVRNELECVRSIAETNQAGQRIDMIASGATVQRVSERIQSASFVHLACHGVQHRTNPLESGFYLSDDRLTISKLMDLKLDRPWLAYLSACETAKGDNKQPDQVMHLAAAMLFAGFKNVVATMWVMNDADGPKMAEWFYEELMSSPTIDADGVAYALDSAVQKLRAQEPEPRRWAQFVHMGA